MDNNQSANTNDLQIPNEIRGFLVSLLDEAGMTATSMEPALYEEMVKELFTRLDKYTTSVLIDKMPAEHLDAFVKMNEEKRPQAEIEQFVKEKMPNAQEVFTQAFVDFRNMYLGKVAVANNAPAEDTKAL